MVGKSTGSDRWVIFLLIGLIVVLLMMYFAIGGQASISISDLVIGFAIVWLPIILFFTVLYASASAFGIASHFIEHRRLTIAYVIALITICIWLLNSISDNNQCMRVRDA